MLVPTGVREGVLWPEVVVSERSKGESLERERVSQEKRGEGERKKKRKRGERETKRGK